MLLFKVELYEHRSGMKFKSEQAKKIIEYVKAKYNSDLEFLWKKFPNNAILRNKVNSKWYAALLVVPKQRLGIEGDGEIEILDFKGNPEKSGILIDCKKFFPGYHMDKKHWITAVLDGSIQDKKLFELIDASYNITNGQ